MTFDPTDPRNDLRSVRMGDEEEEMKKNIGIADRRGRGLVVAPLLLVLAWVAGFGSVGGVIATVLAGVMLGTAAAGACPLYLPFHIDTHRRSSSHA